MGKSLRRRNGQAREKTQTGGVVMSYRYEDGSVQKLLEERPELLG